MAKQLPEYTDRDSPNIKHGLYLGLFHGFKSEEARAAKQDWGDVGPMFGPLQYVHTTYASEVHIEFVDKAEAVEYGLDHILDLPINKDGCVEWDGMQYGDWTAFVYPSRS
jgi:hypothetical protein